MENQQQHQKGLSDKELVTKYEAGEINLAKVLKPTVKPQHNGSKIKENKGK